MSDEDALLRAKRWALRDDFPYYARHCLKVRSKSGAIVPFELNAVQRRVHEAAEHQLARAGRIRMLVLKARQPGISTYVEGRLYWKTTHRKGVRAFILTHRDQATNNLFTIAKRFHDNCPPAVKPLIKASNAKELDFLRLDSGYRVGTAKAEGVGRADTIQLHRAPVVRGADVALAARHVGPPQDRRRRLCRRPIGGEGGQGVAAGRLIGRPFRS